VPPPLNSSVRRQIKTRRIKKNAQGNLIGAALASVIIFILANTAVGHNIVAILLLVVLVAAGFLVFLKVTRLRQKLERTRALQISDIDSMSGHAFERYVAALLEARGFQATVTKGSGDSGVDIIASKGNVRYAIQCKRYAQNISRSAVSDAVGGVAHYKCTHAMVVTNQYFTPGAKALATSNNCVLIDRDTLANWISEWQKQKAGNAAVA
jgi:HJR/Mrr/RecB family endonuclease